MSDTQWAGTGAPATKNQYTWGGTGPRRLCDNEGLPYPDGLTSYVDTINAGYMPVMDDKFGTRQWVKISEMVVWDGIPDPARVILQDLRTKLSALAKILGVAA